MGELARVVAAVTTSTIIAAAAVLGGVGSRLGRRQVGEEIEDVLQVAEDGVVDGQLTVYDLLEVGLDLS